MDTSSTQKYDALVKISQENFQAFLYDCDGTLADNMQAHKDTYIRVAAEQGVVISGDIIDEYAGLPTTKVVELINQRYQSSFDPQGFNDAKYKLFLDEYIEQTQPIDYVVNHLKNHAGKVRIGVVSGGSREAVLKTLKVLGIDHLVESLVCVGKTERGKPFPDPFLKAAQELGVSPEHCLVFEDGDAGVQSAIAAGMKWVRIDKL
jgi:HAD superfamily hydrolase (TIGR01509 family)